MIRNFICPDKERIDAKRCIDQCRMPSRCLTRPTLIVIVSGERQWDGLPHVTSLLNGTLEEFLRVTKDYDLDPRDRAYALLGSTHHLLLEGGAHHFDLFVEPPVRCDFMQGKPDLYDSSEYTLYDYKTWGSYKIAKILGIERQPDKTFAQTGIPDMKDITLQMNGYRYMFARKGVEIRRMYVQATTRDGGLMIARQRGVTEPVYTIEIPAISDDAVVSFFKPRSELLIEAISHPDDISIPVCTPEERWFNRKCKDYCDVAEICPARELWLGATE